MNSREIKVRQSLRASLSKLMEHCDDPEADVKQITERMRQTAAMADAELGSDADVKWVDAVAMAG